MKNEISIIDAHELKGLEKSKADQIKSTFEPMAQMLSEFEQSYNDLISESEKEITSEITAKAKRLRLDIGKVRIETGKIKDKQKEYIKLEDRAIMGVHNILVWAVKEKEDKLKEIENYFEIQEQKRLEELQRTRVEQLSKFVSDAHERELSSMDDDVWNAYLTTKEKEYNDRIEAEKKAQEEKERLEKIEKLRWNRSEQIKPYYNFFNDDGSVKLGEISEDEFSELLQSLKDKKAEDDKKREEERLENERLKKEAEERKKRDDELRPYINFIRDYNKLIDLPEKEYQKQFSDIKKGAQDHWEFERKEQLKKQKELEEKEQKLKSEREKREKLEAELKAKQEAERERQQKELEEKVKKEAEEEARVQAELNKGDSDKVADLINDLELLKSKYVFKSTKNKKMYADVSTLIDKVINHIKQ